MQTLRPLIIAGIAALTISTALPLHARTRGIELKHISSVPASVPGETAAEILAHDPESQRLFVVNAIGAKVDVFDINDPAHPILVGTIDAKLYGNVANGVDVHDGVLAVAVEADPETNPGRVAFFTTDLQPLSSVVVGAQPDMVAFSPDGRYVVTANEGEPSADYGIDPEGTVSIIDLGRSRRDDDDDDDRDHDLRGQRWSGHNDDDDDDDRPQRSRIEAVAALTQSNVRNVGFSAFNRYPRTLLFAADKIRVFGPGATTVAQDIEPEYLTISADSRTAWVTLQENNAVAVVDLRRAEVKELLGLGTKNHLARGNALDASDQDGRINIQNWPVQGFFLPDAIASYQVGSRTYLVLANEGDVRAWGTFNEEKSVGSVTLDPARFPTGATLKLPENLGRLKITNANGDTDGDGDYDQLYSFGARSFSIRTTDGDLVWDSGDQLERITAARYPGNFNASNSNNTFDNRSDDKGPEPEGIAIGTAFGRTYAFVVLERIGGVMTFDISNPRAPVFTDYVNSRDFTVAPPNPLSGDRGPEGVIFIRSEDSPNGKPLVVLANEVSGTTSIYEVNRD